MSRRLRAFKRWMNSQGISYTNNLQFIDNGTEQGISVIATADIHMSDVVAKIPKKACLTIKTSAGRELIEEAGLDGSLGLSVAVMYEKSLKEESMWSGYLQVLPERECLPLVWTLDQVDMYLAGTELHKIVKDDKALMYEDWKECIFPLIASGSLNLEGKYFGAEQYFAAKSLVYSRSFQIDDYHGFGMVPLADLFNHKTGAENVHFTNVSSLHSGSDDDGDVEDGEYNSDHYEELPTEEERTSRKGFPTAPCEIEESLKSNEIDMSSDSDEDSGSLEMIVVKEVKGGEEVFNTYGAMGNAALLHRYGFTERDNSYDIVNIELNLVLEWSLSLFSSRSSRARLSLWRRMGYSGCVSQDSEYFEIATKGEPQFELLLLLYILFLPDDMYQKLNCAVPSNGNMDKVMSMLLSDINPKEIPMETPEIAKDYLLTGDVCDALVSLANIRDTCYGMSSLCDDIKLLSSVSMRDRKLYHSLVLRVREREILENLRTYASSVSYQGKKPASMSKRRR